MGASPWNNPCPGDSVEGCCSAAPARRSRNSGMSEALPTIDLYPSSLTSTSTSAAKAWGSHLHRVPPHTDKRHTPQRCASVLQSTLLPTLLTTRSTRLVSERIQGWEGTHWWRYSCVSTCKYKFSTRCCITSRGTSLRRPPTLSAGVGHWSRSANVARRLSSPPSFHLSLHTRGQGCDQPLRIEHDNWTHENRTYPRIFETVARPVRKASAAAALCAMGSGSPAAGIPMPWSFNIDWYACLLECCTLPPSVVKAPRSP
jgi:hypothetical protein